MDKQSDFIDMNALYSKGYTIRQAAEKVGVSFSHLAYVLRGERRSRRLIARLHALPSRPLVLRERKQAKAKNTPTR